MEEQRKKSNRKPTQEELMEAIMALRGKRSTLPTPMIREIKPPPPNRFGPVDEEEAPAQKPTPEELAEALQALKGKPLPAPDATLFKGVLSSDMADRFKDE